MNQLQTALVSAGLKSSALNKADKVAKAVKRRELRKLRNTLVVSLLPFGRLGKALAKAKKGKRSQAAIKLSITSTKTEICAVNLELRGLIG